MTGFQGEGIIFGKERAECVFALEIPVLSCEHFDHLGLRSLFEFQIKGTDNSSNSRTWEKWYLNVTLYYRPNTDIRNRFTLQYSPQTFSVASFEYIFKI